MTVDVVAQPSPWALVRRARLGRVGRPVAAQSPFFTGRVDGVAVREVAAVDDQSLGAVQAIHRARVARKCCWSVALLLARAWSHKQRPASARPPCAALRWLVRRVLVRVALRCAAP